MGPGGSEAAAVRERDRHHRMRPPTRTHFRRSDVDGSVLAPASAGRGVSHECDAAWPDVRYFKGHRHARHRSQACFSHNEEFVVSSDDGGPSADIVAWSARTAELLQRSAAGHTSTIRCVLS